MRLPIHSRPFALPFTKALQAQLDRPADAVLRDYADLQLAWVKAKAAAFRGDEPPLTGLKMIDALAVACLARAALGSDTLMGQVADRLEGRPAVRSGESDIDEATRHEMLASLEDIVREMNRRPGMERPSDAAKKIEVEVKVETVENGPDAAGH
jgi:hypothetical protein